MKNHISKKRLLSCGLFVVCGIVLFYYYHHFINISSDTTTTLPMSIDLLGGNILLSDWVLGTNNFYLTEILVYAVGKLFGISNGVLINLIPGIAWTLFFFFMMVFLKDETLDHKKETWIFRIGTGCVLLLVAPTASYTLLNANSHNNFYAFFAGYLLILAAYLNKKKNWKLVLLTILGGLLYFSEGMTTMVLIIPLVCVSAVQILKKQYVFIKVGISAILSYGVGKLIFLLFDLLHGLQVRGLPVSLVNLAEIPGRAKGWIDQFAVLFGLDAYFGVAWGVKKVTITILLILYVVALIGCLLRFLKSDWKIQLLFSVTIVNLAACLLTNVVIFHRYIVIGYYCGVLLMVLFWVKLLFRIRKRYQKLAIVGTLAFCGLFSMHAVLKLVDIFQLPRANADKIEVAEFIEQNGLGDGYADFWCASVTSYYTDYDVQITPVYVYEGADVINQYPELIKNQWYEGTDIHYVLTYADQHSGFIHSDTLLQICGPPDEEYVVNQFLIYYWEDDISKFLE